MFAVVVTFSSCRVRSRVNKRRTIAKQSWTCNPTRPSRDRPVKNIVQGSPIKKQSPRKNALFSHGRMDLSQTFYVR